MKIKTTATLQVILLMINFKILNLEIYHIFMNILPKKNTRNKRKCHQNVKNFTETSRVSMDVRSLQASAG